MNETAKHESPDVDSSSTVVAALERLDVKSLSFIQLRRLKNVIRDASERIDEESFSRADQDNSGDTVSVPAQASDD